MDKLGLTIGFYIFISAFILGIIMNWIYNDFELKLSITMFGIMIFLICVYDYLTDKKRLL